MEVPSLSRLSDEDKNILKTMLKEGPFKNLLSALRDEAKELSLGLSAFNLSDAEQLSKAQLAQSRVQGYLMALDQIEDLVNDD